MRILLADDHNMVRDALKSYIERLEPDAEIVSADSFTTAYKAVEEAGDFALVILDLRMPGMDGLDGLRRMRERLPDVPVVIMSGGASHEDVRTAIDLGAQGFLPKTLTGPALVSAIRLIMAGEKFVPFGAVDAPAVESAEADGHALLTQREREVLQYLEKGWSNKEIARALELQEVTIKLHIRGICRKLGAKNRTQAALRAQEARRLQ
ncbi:response regulator transcription factor [Skermanella sp. TT6]|uniref:Response regulator transcription factor n=1 Tax=Skermanella cutis TaxID=2775420 RepID=A0ABX7B727_9PROT|nr:response regulator transcription factor [Skermanella sp. TT6]QQP88276.1 response regulator transcription factor [Skermanella sp. TT6]